MLPEEEARARIDEQLKSAGWEVVPRSEYNRKNPSAVIEASMQGGRESDYLLFIDNKATAVVEAKRASVNLEEAASLQAESYALAPQGWYGFWGDGNKVPLVYLANGKRLLFRNLLDGSGGGYAEIERMHTPKEMLCMIGQFSAAGLGALPAIKRKGLRECQYRAEAALEASFKEGKRRALAVLATGSGKTYLACLASYRFLEYTSDTRRILFLADRNNLASQAKAEFSLFSKTETGQKLSDLYAITRLQKEEDIRGDIVISTIQKLYAVLTGQKLPECGEDEEDEREAAQSDEGGEPIALPARLRLPADYFQLIVVDECHRSIYGRWKAVLDYFSGARVLGLTATPTHEAVAFFDKNIIENYSYEDSVIDGVNVPERIFRIMTRATVHGGTIGAGDELKERSRLTGATEARDSAGRVEYSPDALDRSIVNESQIRTVLREYRDVIYAKLYPERLSGADCWRFIPKTLIFAKDDSHAEKIVELARDVFAEKFEGKKLPENFVRKITYSAGDSNALIRDFRAEKDFRIAVTVTLVATGTDVKPLEVVLFMRDVHSQVLYTQMKGRACRWISDEKIREITPNAQTKECYYVVDAVGVTEHEKGMPHAQRQEGRLSLEALLERLSHGEASDENLDLLKNYCATIQRRYENSALYGHHLDNFIEDFGYSPRDLASRIKDALQQGLPPFAGASGDNSERMALIECLVDNPLAKKKLLEMHRGYITSIYDEDEVIYSGFSKETARSFAETFERYLAANKDRIEALRIIYNSEGALITHSMLVAMRDALLAESPAYTARNIWASYKLLDEAGRVDDFDATQNAKALTHLIQIARYVYKKSATLASLFAGFAQRFSLYCGQAQRQLSDGQKEIMRQIGEFIASEGAVSPAELNEYYPDLWRKAVMAFGAEALAQEMQALSSFILRTA